MVLDALKNVFSSRSFKRKKATRNPEIALHRELLAEGKHNFAYHSGERQTATDLSGIRADHLMRYEWAISQIQASLGPNGLVGGDYFCGNGYGTAMLAQFGEVTGIDGSQDAIDVANQHYSAPGTQFRCNTFPFALAPHSHDFVVSMESVEHVPDATALIKEFADAIKPGGLLILSTPNEALYPFDKDKNPYHFQHYHQSDVLALAGQFGLDMENVIGQKRSPEEAQNVYELCPADEGRFLVFCLKKA